MTTALDKDTETLFAIQKMAYEYGVKEAMVYSKSRLIEITYKEIGQGSILSNLAIECIGANIPERSNRIKMIPSDKKLIVELL